MSQWSVPPNAPSSNAEASLSPNMRWTLKPDNSDNVTRAFTPSPSSGQLDSDSRASPISAQRQRTSSWAGSRPASMVQTYQPPLMEVAQDTLYVNIPTFPSQPTANKVDV